MSSADEELEAAIRALGQVFISKLPGKLAEIEDAKDAFLRDPNNKEHEALLHRLLHTMAGSAGTFGFPDMGTKARALESQLKSYMQGEAWDSSQIQEFCQHVEKYIQESRVAEPEAESETLAPAKPAVVEAERKLIYLVDSDLEKTAEMVQQLEQFAFDVCHIECLEHLGEALDEKMPSFLVIDLDCQHGYHAGGDEIERLKSQGRQLPPTLFMSNLNSFESRLRAVRAGGDGFFLKPVDVLALTERLEEIIALPEPRLYRILIIDDDVDLTQAYSSMLKSAGMVVEVLNDPELVLEHMSSFRPELILMDIYMPNCDGVELSKVIRQDHSYLDVPIIFLSSEQDEQKQIAAVKVGADDFLCKPIAPELLISSLSSRAERFRSLRTLVMRDGLTGLYNHTAIKEDLIAKISSASRTVTCVAVAMIDLDNFKLVNDTYGHQMGDQVLRTLSHMLKQRLRKSDAVGRYGGEEFIVIFPNTTADVARMVLEKIRVAFSRVVHVSEHGEFKVGFSAGIADSRQTANPEELLTIADAALYKAKASGKNQVLLGE
ncbi:diguanylate cyclase [Undibacterium sp. LX40W]|uniref:diguanylate cyclase n=1 Tax=Undibacterium nitidum TaxID=2762298 RepID=A0A923HQP4_9BURK|nr:diguanylate cyclase [Undibacterium nitidum]MBC3880717.1 diguanylate cyclase [Undibacterium nitidum]MBC3890548.1 diguanylate cyclase [Undibacterium sp. LX40W]